MHTITHCLTITAAIVPATAYAADGEQRFVHDGVTYVYIVAEQAGGRRVIEGRSLSDGRRFHLMVARNEVTGTSGGLPVAFSVASARGAASGDTGGIETTVR